MKLCYKFEIKKIKSVDNFEALKLSASKAFKDTGLKVEQMKFWYLDSDDDIISVSNQADFEDFQEGLQGFQMRLIIAETIEEAKTQLSEGNSNMELKINESFDITQEAMETQTDFQMNADSHSIACGEDSVFDKITSNCATDARDMIKDLVQQNTIQNSFGCNTENFDLVDKPVDAIVETNEIASQCKAQYNDMNSQTQVKTESQGCQKEITMNETGVSCLIIGPEDINQTEVMSSDEDLPDCFRCDGNKVNKKGLPCKKCNGTGKLNNKFFRDLHKILSDEIRKYCTQEYQKLLIQHIEQKREAQNKVVHHNIKCDRCQMFPIVGIRYKCTVRENYDLCESCESKHVQPHLMLKIRDPKHTPAYLICQFDGEEE